MNLEEKKKAREQVLKTIEKEHGKGSAGVYGNMPKLDVEVISTGSLALDDAVGVGGYPRGRIVEIYGPEASGKTTLTLHAIAEAQKRGGLCAFIDAEHALDPVYAANLGVDMNELTLSQPDNGEQALEIAETLTASGVYDVIVIDSVSALVPKAELEGEMGQSHIGKQARLMSQACRKLSAVVSRTKTIFIFINQIRHKIGVMFGSPETTSGGNALKFYASVRIDIRRISTIKQGDDALGNRSKVKVVKNKVSAPFKTCEFDIIFGKGVNRAGEVLDSAVILNLVDKSGAWYSMGEQRLGQGRDNVCDTLRANPEVLDKLEKDTRKLLGL
jgi:recombination protein RecA